MKIEIRKYLYVIGKNKNYFDSPLLVDKLILTDIPNDAIPIFNEEIENSFDTFDFTASDFDINLSLLSTTRSMNNDFIEVFFKYFAENQCFAVKVELDGKVFGGMMDMSSLKFDYTTSQNRYNVSFTIYSFEKEFSEIANGRPNVAPFPYSNFFNDFFGHSQQQNPFFRNSRDELMPEYFIADLSALAWEQVNDYHPCLVKELWNDIIGHESVTEGNQRDFASTWKLWQDICVGFGLVYQFRIRSYDIGDYFAVVMHVGFRHIGFQYSAPRSRVIDKITHEEHLILNDKVKERQFFKFQKANYNAGISEERFFGTYMDSEHLNNEIVNTDAYVIEKSVQPPFPVPSFNTFIQEGVYDSGNEDVYAVVKFTDPLPNNLSKKETTITDMNYYFQSVFNYNGSKHVYFFETYTTRNLDLAISETLSEKAISFPRMWTRYDYEINDIYVPAIATTFHFIKLSTGGDFAIHNAWYVLMINTLGKAYKFLIKGLKRKLVAETSLLNNDDLELYDKTTETTGEHKSFLLTRISNLDLVNKKAETEWIEI